MSIPLSKVDFASQAPVIFCACIEIGTNIKASNVVKFITAKRFNEFQFTEIK